jgi:hypothetical protein
VHPEDITSQLGQVGSLKEVIDKTPGYLGGTLPIPAAAVKHRQLGQGGFSEEVIEKTPGYLGGTTPGNQAHENAGYGQGVVYEVYVDAENGTYVCLYVLCMCVCICVCMYVQCEGVVYEVYVDAENGTYVCLYVCACMYGC